MRFQLQEGQQVVCHGDIDVYPPRGSYQLVVQQVEPQGLGALQLAFKQLQARLAAEGLFDRAAQEAAARVSPARRVSSPVLPARQFAIFWKSRTVAFAASRFW